MESNTYKAMLVTAVFIANLGTALATELVYRPTNPSFGGDPRNSAHLLGLAGPQNQFRDTGDQLTPTEEFNQRLQASLLSRITSAVTRDIVDIDGNITPGFFETTDYIINITDDGTGLMTIETTDRVTGETTVIQVRNDIGL